MRFTEHELTQAMQGAAKAVLASRRGLRKPRRDVEEAWASLGGYERYQLLDSVGDQVLPVLVALPDVEVEPGTRPTFTEQQVREAVEERLTEDVGRVRREVLVRARVALVQQALAGIPPRQDPDGLVVPDHPPEDL